MGQLTKDDFVIEQGTAQVSLRGGALEGCNFDGQLLDVLDLEGAIDGADIDGGSNEAIAIEALDILHDFAEDGVAEIGGETVSVDQLFIERPNPEAQEHCLPEEEPVAAATFELSPTIS